MKPLFLRLFVLLAIAVSSALAKPNVVVVVADQWRAQAFGFTGDPNVKTPHFDALAARSVHFSNAVSGVPVCTPFRGSLLTGQRPLTNGLFLNDVPLDPGATTIAKVMKGAGYDTGVIGKWHVDGHGRSAFIPVERRQGFDYWKVLECTHNYNRSPYYGNTDEKLFWDGYDAAAQTADACNYLRDHGKSGKPFMLLLTWGPPHNPYEEAAAKYRAMYDPAKLQLRPNVPAQNEAEARRALAGYYAHCTALDDCMAQILDALKASGLEEDTILLFTADHGDMIFSQGQIRKQRPWDESIRTPMLIHWPKGLGTKGRVVDALINSEDLMPTLLGLSGVKIPSTVEGLDYTAYLRNGAPDPSGGSTVIACPSPFGEYTRAKGGREYRGVRTTRYTYVRDLNGPWLLFDNETDPYQLKNLVNTPENAALQKTLEDLLTQKLKDRHDEFKPGPDYIAKWGYQVDANGTMPYKN